MLLAAVALRPRAAAPSRGAVERRARRRALRPTTAGSHARDLRVTLGGREILRGLDLDVARRARSTR